MQALQTGDGPMRESLPIQTLVMGTKKDGQVTGEPAHLPVQA